MAGTSIKHVPMLQSNQPDVPSEPRGSVPPPPATSPRPERWNITDCGVPFSQALRWAFKVVTSVLIVSFLGWLLYVFVVMSFLGTLIDHAVDKATDKVEQSIDRVKDRVEQHVENAKDRVGQSVDKARERIDQAKDRMEQAKDRVEQLNTPASPAPKQ